MNFGARCRGTHQPAAHYRIEPVCAKPDDTVNSFPRTAIVRCPSTARKLDMEFRFGSYCPANESSRCLSRSMCRSPKMRTRLAISFRWLLLAVAAALPEPVLFQRNTLHFASNAFRIQVAEYENIFSVSFGRRARDRDARYRNLFVLPGNVHLANAATTTRGRPIRQY